MQAATGGEADAVGAWTASAVFGVGAAMLVCEYVAASKRFDAGEIVYMGAGARPTAGNLEASYGFDLLGKPARAGIGYQGSRESVALGLPESRVLAALSVEVVPHAALSVEYAHDEDYGVAEGGSGESADTVLAQLAVEF